MSTERAIAEHDVVVLTRDVPEHKLVAGDTGVVVSIHADAAGAPRAYLVELFAVDGSTIDVVDVPADSVRRARHSDLSHARHVAAEQVGSAPPRRDHPEPIKFQKFGRQEAKGVVVLASIDELRAALRRFSSELAQLGDSSSPALGALEEGGLTDAQVDDLETIFSCTLPESFRVCVQKYDLSRVTIGPTVFSGCRTYFDELVSANRDTTWSCGSPWVFPEASREEPRPPNLLLIGDREPYFVLLDVRDGAMLGLDVERLYPDAVRVAGDLMQFLQCSGALWLAALRNQPLDEVREEAVRVTRGDRQFWSV